MGKFLKVIGITVVALPVLLAAAYIIIWIIEAVLAPWSNLVQPFILEQGLYGTLLGNTVDVAPLILFMLLLVGALVHTLIETKPKSA